MFVAGEVAKRLSVEADVAVASGVVDRVKVQGRWLYYDPATLDVEEALDGLAVAIDTVLAEWLLNPAQYLVGQAIKAAQPLSISHSACRVLVQELCRRHRLDGLGLMNRSLQPYLAFFRLEDRDEIERQVDAMEVLLSRQGSVTWRQLPAPERPLPREAWRKTVLAHGAWLGLGHRPEPGVLEAW